MFSIRAISYKRGKARVLLEFDEDDFHVIVRVLSKLVDSAQFLRFKVGEKKKIKVYRDGGEQRMEAVRKFRVELLDKYESMQGRPVEKMRRLKEQMGERTTLDRVHAILQLAREDRKNQDSEEARKISL